MPSKEQKQGVALTADLVKPPANLVLGDGGKYA
jgi:hypothetical protein